MGRSTGQFFTDNPLDLVMRFGRFYLQNGKTGTYNQIFFFSTLEHASRSLLVFGGSVYKQRGGWAWIMGKRKELQALYKLLEPFSEWEMNDALKPFMAWARGNGWGQLEE